jgi:hypothetical protein
MRTRSILWFCALGAGILAPGVIVVSSSKEPCYAGKPLGLWIGHYPAIIVFTNGYSQQYPGFYASRAQAEADQDRLLRTALEARRAVKSMGTQCLPFLLRRLSTRDDVPLRNVIVGWGIKLHVLKPTWYVDHSPPFVRGQALKALLDLDQVASPAIPELVALADGPDKGVRLAARHALDRLSPYHYDFRHQ